MRLLVACPACRRQYRAREDKIGTRFRCQCGQVVSVKQPRGHDSRVVRCSSCGAARSGPSRSCEHCGSDFTLYERDLFTVCPHCLTNVSDRARYCHSCGHLIAPEEPIGPISNLRCPACRDEPPLHSRRLGVSGHGALECDACAGLWLGVEVFEHFVRKAQEKAAPPLFRPGERVELVQPDLPPRRTGYCPCPVCGSFMHRRNYGLRQGRGGSGIVIEYCKPHGVWFDSAELTGVLNWIRRGGPPADLGHSPSKVRDVSLKPTDADAAWTTLSRESEEPFSFDLLECLFHEPRTDPFRSLGLFEILFDLDR